MSTWGEILDVDGPPVRGEPDEFLTAYTRFDAMATDAQTIVDGFAELADIESHPDRLLGSFTGRLQTAFSGVDEGLQVLPRVAGEAAGFFSDHHDALVDLRERSDRAFERALAAWTEKNALESSLADLEGQMPSLFGVAPDDLEDVVDQRRRLGPRIESARGSIGTQDGILDAVREEWGDLRDAEDGWDSTTVEGLDGIDLGDLEDPGFWDRVCNAVGDFLDTVGELAMGAIDGLVDLVEGLVDVLAAAWDRLSTFAQYMAQTFWRRLTNPTQTMWDLLTGTILIEDVAAAYAILGQDGELYNDGPYCGEEASCIVGVPVPEGSAAITLGHTVLFSNPNPPAWGSDNSWDSLVAHEMQHVYDIEAVGGVPFYVSYGAMYLVNRAKGMNDDDAYENIWWEQRAYAVSRGEREPQGLWADVWDATTESLSDLPPPRLPVGPIPVPVWPPIIGVPGLRPPTPFPIPWPP